MKLSAPRPARSERPPPWRPLSSPPPAPPGPPAIPRIKAAFGDPKSALDVIEELVLEVPGMQAELPETARKIRAATLDLYGLVVGGAYAYGAMSFIWSDGGELAGWGGLCGSGAKASRWFDDPDKAVRFLNSSDIRIAAS